MIRPYSDEIFPAEAGYEGERTQDIIQGSENSCTTMGITNAPESLVHAWEEQQGIPLADSLQLSPAFLWRLLKLQPSITVDSAVALLNKTGTCLEKLYPYTVEPDYPFRVTAFDTDPSNAAWEDASARKIELRVANVNGKFDMARAIATGSRLITTRVGGPLEHVEAGIKYHQDLGIRIHGSGGTRFWEPWSSFEPGGVMSKVVAITHCNLAPFIVHPDYRPPSIPTFSQGVLTVPYVTLMPVPDPYNWDAPIQYFKNVVVHFGSDINDENYAEDDADMNHMDVRWKPASPFYGTPHKLSLFAVNIEGRLAKRVTVTGVLPRIISYERV